MLEEIELYVYDKFIKDLVVESNGEKIIFKEELEKLDISLQEKNFIMYIINKKKIRVVEEKITKEDRSPYVRDNNYGDIQANDLQKIDEPVMSKIEYSSTNEKIFENYSELDEYLEKRFIPSYVLLKRRKNDKGEIEYFPSIRLYHIMALKLSEAELEHVMNYLKERNIRVGGKGATLDGEFENYDYVTTYKESALPLSVPASVTLENIKEYKKNNNDIGLRQKILTDNIRLVPYVAYRYAISTGIDQHELESYGYEGLHKALEKFDINYGCSFSTYAISYIRGYILNGIQIIVQGRKDDFYYDYVNAKSAVESECGLTISEAPYLIEDVIDLLVATGKIKDNENARAIARTKINYFAIGDLSLDDEEVVEKLTNEDALVYDYLLEEIMEKRSREEINEILNTCLTPREAEIIRLRFGFYGTQYSLEEAGNKFGVTRERVRQIEAKALRKLRKPSITERLRRL